MTKSTFWEWMRKELTIKGGKIIAKDDELWITFASDVTLPLNARRS
ncbi:MAG: hypothetical protein KIH08_14195 [Candidatus Freyarchaeota archaeon]|nr:hypothetical protein [Candidatus Jordarchaeia archaeon]MBS7270483.1 hypothetical protein [Candidatus Jordarchaeia archaeon]MBS7281245.1 hypothetical protein [Candidatus Jordarchaeia archaeon]